MKFTFKKDERLRKKKEFDNVFANGRWIKGCFVNVCYTFSKGRKAGFVVSKKISKKAVVRNKVKRRLREIFRLNKYSLPDNVHLVIIAKRGVEKANFSELENDVKQIFQEINNQAN
ncbi:ribonuclease P protein component [Deferribacter autotrophicus]|uniref:Ribonuclease P protein component n=1 Tax=Deferribacter autotrophicus TaxID=500465 RepID=A0A5A8F642_9BACT|nr:ribonuclease P protein component [Deferribacter autotrophicus]KAA0259015.1 ribonuclease P protein component [Deferribacter autotrophicus]